MTKLFTYIAVFSLSLLLFSCDKDSEAPEPVKPGGLPLYYQTLTINGTAFSGTQYESPNLNPKIEISFPTAIDPNSVPAAVRLTDKNSNILATDIVYKNNDSIILIQPALNWISKYNLSISNSLKSKSGGALLSSININITTPIDSTDKFPRISDNDLLDLIQKQTFKYFWDFGHPTSGMARERNSSGDLVTSGGTGFGIMAMIVATERQFISRTEATQRIQKIVSFLKNKCTPYHGVFAHWINGESGATIPFSTKDNGADLVETAFLMQGLLTARQYLDGAGNEEKQLRADINQLWQSVDWNWFQKNNENVLYWHWSSNYGWDMNHKIQGWNECLITYVLAASSPTHTISKNVYTQGWAQNGNFKNGSKYYDIALPLGPSYGGPLFFEHYSFLGLNPKGLSDTYVDYWKQAVNHTRINRAYCVQNPAKRLGYSGDCWGLTASDIPGGYTASSPTNDVGVVAPTAAISSLPYTPEESLNTIKHFYYKLGDKLWGNYGFMDAFNLDSNWFSGSYLAIDQGPQIIMIENHRTGLLWKLFMSCPEVQTGLTKLEFKYQTD